MHEAVRTGKDLVKEIYALLDGSAEEDAAAGGGAAAPPDIRASFDAGPSVYMDSPGDGSVDVN